MFNNTDALFCLRNKMACSSLAFIQLSLQISPKSIQGYGIDILRKKGGPCGHRTGFPPTPMFLNVHLKISVSACFYLKMQLQNKETTACENAHWQVSSCFSKDSYLTVLISKGLD